MRPLFQMLVDAGAPVSGWRLSAATGVSADGSVIVGWGHRPDGEERAWRAVLAPCVADFNRDGGIDGADVEAFFALWEAGGCG